jgi:hypothetical protein|uniref:Uncharacterized protein n=1 Tax=Virus NIOZ-UU159 TaxID=2763270 RepID=A0A7S9XGE7_9VIRU|nr:MAG: hypothetical protein NIOZUU159_00062 [Virus NIOZ-UU159]
MKMVMMLMVMINNILIEIENILLNLFEEYDITDVWDIQNKINNI